MNSAVARTDPSGVQQWWVLTVRVVAPTFRNGELAIAVALSAVFTVSFYIPLREVMSGFVPGNGGYAQYLMPLIAVQAVFFAAMSAAIRSATDSVQGVERRFRSLPVSPFVPLAARMTANGYRCAVALAVAVLCGYAIGFRFYGNGFHTAAFCLLVIAIGLSVSLVGDVIGVAVRRPEATPHLLLVPQLILGYLSVGIQPAEQFPRWIQPFVRHQPVSVFVEALRALAGNAGTAPGGVATAVAAACGWVVVLSVAAVVWHRRLTARNRR
ncbi:ABC transporter permease [Mycobacterium manitobense]|uniref:ABC transporter permease n=1 Tax=[Mycobacterium] manitobense TaxID=190147 RepID=A0A9X2YQ72_9MYCO|nr:ABC transporter permease [[Mycobacterium] manitobense]